MNLQNIKESIIANGNVKTFTMQVLRDAVGAERLGNQIRANISTQLAGMGIGHVPETVPNDQTATIRLYIKGTSAGNMIDTILTPGETNDQKITQQSAEQRTDLLNILNEIKDLVSDL